MNTSTADPFQAQKIPPKMQRRGYDTYNPDRSWLCSDCGVSTPMRHKLSCKKLGVKKSIVPMAW